MIQSTCKLINNLYFYPVALIRILLFPISLLYGFLTFVRNKLFDWNILSSQSFNIPIISLGNLSTGGTGKTPHVEYLIRLLQGEKKVATLSRGYKRKSAGFLMANDNTSVDDIGDEPFQFKIKFPEVTVAVDEKRVHGVESLLSEKNDINVVLLDDAFQHRYIKPGLSILLTDFFNLYTNDFVVPTGSLREFRRGAKRADIIIVTKSPKVLSPLTLRNIISQINPKENQKVYFSFIKHGKLSQIPGVDFIPDQQHHYSAIMMVAGIANPYPLELKLRDRCTNLEKLNFSDHHQFTEKDIDKIIQKFDSIFAKNKIIVTTEKDMGRLRQPELFQKIKSFPICYMPIEVKIHKDDRMDFDNQIIEYVRKN